MNINKTTWIRAGATIVSALIVITVTIMLWILEQRYQKLENRIAACEKYVDTEIEQIAEEIQDFASDFITRHAVSHFNNHNH